MAYSRSDWTPAKGSEGVRNRSDALTHFDSQFEELRKGIERLGVKMSDADAKVSFALSRVPRESC